MRRNEQRISEISCFGKTIGFIISSTQTFMNLRCKGRGYRYYKGDITP